MSESNDREYSMLLSQEYVKKKIEDYQKEVKIKAQQTRGLMCAKYEGMMKACDELLGRFGLGEDDE